MSRLLISLIASLGASVLLAGVLVWFIVGMPRGTVSGKTVLATTVALVIALYVTLMLSNAGLGIEFQDWGGGRSLEDARRAGTLVATYAPSCTDGSAGVLDVYAEHLTKKELGVLLWPRARVSTGIKVVSRLEPRGFVPGGPSLSLEFEDGAGAAIDHETGEPSVRDQDPNKTSCCFDVRLRAPERFWLLRDGERVCEFTRRADA